MNKFLVTTALLLIYLYLPAQELEDSWRIRLNNKLRLATSKENEKANLIKVKSSEWTTKGWLEITFKESYPGVWKRSFLLYDDQDNELWRKDSVTHSKLSTTTLRKLFSGKKEIRIYTTVSPVDPNIAVKMRRVHLCTLRLP